METSYLRFKYLGDLTVAAAMETGAESKVSTYNPMTVLIYIEQGDKHYEVEGQKQVFPEGSYMVIRKFTDGVLYKTLNPGQRLAKGYAFALTDEFVREVIDDIDIPHDLPPVSKRVIGLEKNDLLDELMGFVKNCFDHDLDMDKAMVKEKTREAIRAVCKADPGIAAIFREYTRAQRVDLSEYMEEHYLLRMPLNVFAVQSGRSLSTFHRDFKMIFGETPHRWIMRKRLMFAKNLLVKKLATASEAYMQAGFEDLAHFSRAFKKQFGYPPSKTLEYN